MVVTARAGAARVALGSAADGGLLFRGHELAGPVDGGGPGRHRVLGRKRRSRGARAWRGLRPGGRPARGAERDLLRVLGGGLSPGGTAMAGGRREHRESRGGPAGLDCAPEDPGAPGVGLARSRGNCSRSISRRPSAICSSRGWETSATGPWWSAVWSHRWRGGPRSASPGALLYFRLAPSLLMPPLELFLGQGWRSGGPCPDAERAALRRGRHHLRRGGPPESTRD